MLKIDIHAQDTGEQPGHVEGVVLAGDDAGELGRGFDIDVLEDLGGQLDDFAVQGFDFRGFDFVGRQGDRFEAGAEVVFVFKGGEAAAFDAYNKELEFAVTDSGGSLDDGFGGSGKEVGRSGDLDGGIALSYDEDLLCF